LAQALVILADWSRAPEQPPTQTGGLETRMNPRLWVLNAQEPQAQNRANTGESGRKKTNREWLVFLNTGGAESTEHFISYRLKKSFYVLEFPIVTPKVTPIIFGCPRRLAAK
jgi:hypothetical protein